MTLGLLLYNVEYGAAIAAVCGVIKIEKGNTLHTIYACFIQTIVDVGDDTMFYREGGGFCAADLLDRVYR